MASSESCFCGRGFPLLGPIEGRSLECLRTPSGGEISPAIFVYHDHWNTVRHYQLVQESANRVKLLIVRGERWDEQRRDRLRSSSGRIYISDEHNDAIRVRDLDGNIRTLAGGNGPGFSGDGGPASRAQIADPENILERKDRSILITVRDNARLRIVSPDGIIHTVAGRGPTSRHDYYAPISLPSVEP